MRWSLGILGGLIALIVIAAALALVGLQTPAGKAWLAAEINRRFAGEARVAGLAGALPFHPRIAEIDLLDPAGEWARLADAALDLDPWDLLRGRAAIARLTARRLDVARSPQSTTPAEPPSQELARLFEIPRVPLRVDLDRLAIETIHLDAPVLGEPLDLTLHGSATLAKGNTALALSLARIDGQAGHADIDIKLAGAPARLTASLHVAEPNGHLLQGLLARGEPLPLTVSLAGDGPLANWRGRLTAAAGAEARLDTELAIDGSRDGLHVAMTGSLAAAALLPPKLASVIGQHLGFAVRLVALADNSLVLDGLTVDAAALRLAGSGAYRSESQSLGLALRVEVPALDALTPLLGAPLAGPAEITVTAAGPGDKPALAVTLRGDGIGFGDDHLDHIAAMLAVTPQAPLDDPALRYAVAASGRLEGIRLGAAALPGDLGEALDWRLAGTIDRSGQQFDIAALDAADSGVTLTGQASLDRARQAATARLRLAVDRLARFATGAGNGLAGRGEVEAALDSEGPGAAKLTVKGDLDDLATGMPIADALLGRRVTLDLAAHRDEAGGPIRLDAATLGGANLQIRARGELAPEGRTIVGSFAVAAPSLASLESAGLPLRGRLRLDGKLGGTLASPTVDARLDATDLAWRAIRFDRIAAQIAAQAGPSPAATLTADFQSGKLKGTLSGEGAVSDGGKVLTLRRLRLAGAGSTLDAALRTTLDTRLTSGTITLRSPDLSPWSPLVGAALAGRLNARLALAARDESQGATLSLSADKLRLTPASGAALGVARVTAAGTLADLLRRPSGKLTLDLAGGEAGASRIEQLHVTVQSVRPDRLVFSTRLAGRVRVPVTLAASGEVAMGRDTLEVTLSQLTGKLADDPLRLTRPLTVVARGRDLAVSNLALVLGAGRLDGEARLTGERVAANLAARQLPIGLAGKLAGHPDLQGALDLRLSLDGSVREPRGRLEAELRQLRFAPPGQAASPPPLGARLTATLGPGQVSLDGAVLLAEAKVVSITGTAPLRLALRPVAIAVPTDRPLDLRLQGDGRLERFADLLPLGGSRLAGRFHLDARIGGTLAAPDPTGSFTLDQGHYEDLSTGLVLDNATIEVVGANGRILLRRLAAGDGVGGTLAGSGAVTLAGPAQALDLNATFRQFRAVHRDDATAKLSGDARIAGSLVQPRVTAQLRVDEANLYIPDRLPPRAQKLDVVVIDSRTGRVIAGANPPPAQPATAAIALDIRIDIPGRTFVRGRGLDSEWKGQLHIGGTSAAPEIVGQLQVVHGTLAFFGKDLALTRGTITFTGGHKIAPQLDFLAETTASGITAQIVVSGTPEDLKITLTSQPPLPQDEILARVLFGRGVAQMTPAQGLQLAQAVAALASGGPGVLDRVRSSLGLDVLSFGSSNPNSSTAQAGSGSSAGSAGTAGTAGGVGAASVTAGKYLANGVYVGVQQSASGESKSSVSVEVLPDVTVSSSVGVRGGNDIGLNWKLDY
ncbi:MAG TPA: translocation/assembly module TamB domain-containing protein [Alphaproteobacteria bacterium]|nr:translocation/assembly module TamB domain-containing protein [Alphaproteobacteria bacterium]